MKVTKLSLEKWALRKQDIRRLAKLILKLGNGAAMLGRHFGSSRSPIISQQKLFPSPCSSLASFIHRSLSLFLSDSQKLQSVCLLGTYFWPSSQRPAKRLPQGPKLSFPVQNTQQAAQIPFYKYLSFPSQSFPNRMQRRQTSRPEANHNLGCSTQVWEESL